jgi:hypothetical protein
MCELRSIPWPRVNYGVAPREHHDSIGWKLSRLAVQMSENTVSLCA